MNKNKGLTRRNILVRAFAGAGALTLAECQKLSESTWISRVQGVGEKVSYRAQRPLLPRKAMAQEFAEIRELPHRTQTTRHDCVEGWSAIGKWQGARLSALLEAVRPKPNARYVVFDCADPMGSGKSHYYESIDM